MGGAYYILMKCFQPSFEGVDISKVLGVDQESE